MRWQGERESSNVDDRRGKGGGLAIGGGIGVTIIGILVYFFTGDPSMLLSQSDQGGAPKTEQEVTQEDQYLKFVKVTFGYTEDVWNKEFSNMGRHYEEPTLVTFDGATTSGCGNASASTGPFYCPADRDVYIDLSFYNELRDRFGASGDFAMAYVIAHEVGHHVQNLLGISEKVRRAQEQGTQEEANALSVKLELQADFLAGYWANHIDKMKKVLEEGDIEEALNAAQAIGDDRLQKQAQGYAVPETFTHGTSAQRMYWFKKGYTTGNLDDGNTFGKEITAFRIPPHTLRQLAVACFLNHSMQ